jgi:hypothetical protein
MIVVTLTALQTLDAASLTPSVFLAIFLFVLSFMGYVILISWSLQSDPLFMLMWSTKVFWLLYLRFLLWSLELIIAELRFW